MHIIRWRVYIYIYIYIYMHTRLYTLDIYLRSNSFFIVLCLIYGLRLYLQYLIFLIFILIYLLLEQILGVFLFLEPSLREISLIKYLK
jgi:hypothetical protein